MRHFTRIFIGFMAAVGVAVGASATTITHTMGNATPGFSDGDTPGAAAAGAAQGGQPIPFDQGYGTDGLFGGNFAVSWTHSFAAIGDPIQAASITIGIFDHDSAASGSQLALFDVDGTSLTVTLDGMFEVAGDGLDGMYNEYTLTLAGTSFGALADGTVLVQLTLQGPGLVTPLFPLPGPNPPTETSTNGANLIFSTLQITTRDQGTGTVIPEPTTAWLMLLGLGLLGLYGRARRWRRRQG